MLELKLIPKKLEKERIVTMTVEKYGRYDLEDLINEVFDDVQEHSEEENREIVLKTVKDIENQIEEARCAIHGIKSSVECVDIINMLFDLLNDEIVEKIIDERDTEKSFPYFGKVMLAVCLFFTFLGGVRLIINNFICVYQVYGVYLYCN